MVPRLGSAGNYKDEFGFYLPKGSCDPLRFCYRVAFFYFVSGFVFAFLCSFIIHGTK